MIPEIFSDRFFSTSLVKNGSVKESYYGLVFIGFLVRGEAVFMVERGG